MDYLVISPVKDEERHVEHTLRSMVSQTCKPTRWIIVDDGSSDRTPELLKRYAQGNDFIHVVRNKAGQSRQPGPAVIRAFHRGLDEARALGLNHDFIVKLDCDLSFEPDYFEQLLLRFSEDSRLGIASGVYLETLDGKNWEEVPMPSYHAAGASKVIRRACWEEIGGFIPSRGWDTVDEIRAMSRGWRSTHFGELRMKHWKREGAGIGPLKTSVMHGEIYCLTGGGLLFFLLKLVHRLKAQPVLIGALAMAWGFLRTKCSTKKMLVSRDEAKCYRALLNGRIFSRLRRQGREGLVEV